jgi:hypothetical protein
MILDYIQKISSATSAVLQKLLNAGDNGEDLLNESVQNNIPIPVLKNLLDKADKLQDQIQGTDGNEGALKKISGLIESILTPILTFLTNLR